MTPRISMLLPVVVAAVPLLLLAQSVTLASAASDCLSMSASTLAQDTSVVVCGFPLPAGAGEAPDVPFACDHKASKLLTLLKAEPGLQALTADKICYITFNDTTDGTILNTNVVTNKAYTRSVRVRLLDSVSELVGMTPVLYISGPGLSHINPAIFSAIRPAQKRMLKALALIQTNLASIDLSLLENLDIKELLLLANLQLTRITNNKSVKLAKLRNIRIWGGNNALADCRNFKALPSNLETVHLLLNRLEKNCALCYLPKSVREVVVFKSLSSLPFHPSAVATEMPSISILGRNINLKQFEVDPSTTSGCNACSCKSDLPDPQDLQNFHPMMGFDCVGENFTRPANHLTSVKDCATACSGLQDCQAFTMSDGRCKMFVFNKCSKNVRECRCNRLTRVFIRKQPGLSPGALCPADYGHSNCGVKYKFIHDTNRWDVAMAKCSSESGLVIMAEPIDMGKFNYLTWLYHNKCRRPGDPQNFYFGGSQDPGSAEPAGGWHWSTCRIPIAAHMWSPDQPSNSKREENFACTWRPESSKLSDCDKEVSTPKWDRFSMGAFCECASPFD